MGLIVDWKPVYYEPNDIQVPYFLPDSQDIRRDICDQYTTISRLDQGINNLVCITVYMLMLSNDLLRDWSHNQ